MPLEGYNLIDSSLPGNRVDAEAKAGTAAGTAGFNSVALGLPGSMDANPSDNVGDLVAQTTGLVTQYAVTANAAIAVPTGIALNLGIDLGNRMTGDGLLTAVTGTQTQDTILNYQQLRTGLWVDASGTSVNPSGAGVNYQINGTGDNPMLPGRKDAQDYDYSLAGVPTNASLGIRTQ